MAFLQGRIPSGFIPERQYDLEITAIRPSSEGPRDAYKVVVRRNADKVFEQIYSVQNFTGGHYVMWQVVNLLRHAPDIMDKKPEFRPFRCLLKLGVQRKRSHCRYARMPLGCLSSCLVPHPVETNAAFW